MTTLHTTIQPKPWIHSLKVFLVLLLAYSIVATWLLEDILNNPLIDHSLFRLSTSVTTLTLISLVVVNYIQNYSVSTKTQLRDHRFYAGAHLLVVLMSSSLSYLGISAIIKGLNWYIPLIGAILVFIILLESPKHFKSKLSFGKKITNLVLLISALFISFISNTAAIFPLLGYPKVVDHQTLQAVMNFDSETSELLHS